MGRIVYLNNGYEVSFCIVLLNFWEKKLILGGSGI